MALTFTSTMAGASANYSKYLYGSPTKTARYKDSELLDFSLAPGAAGFVKLVQGAYITLNTTKYGKWFTGYIVNEPELTYLGATPAGVLVYGYKYQATSDDYILNLKPIGLIEPFLNTTMGAIVKALATRLAPGMFTYVDVDNGPIIAKYAIEPDKKFQDVVRDLCEAGNFVFYARDHKLFFKSQDDADVPKIVLDAENTHFTPSRLNLRPSATPVVNDVTVLGSLEPQDYVHEYFVGTGVDASFPLIASVFGADTSVLLDDVFTGTSLNTNVWREYDTVVNYIQLSNGYLNILGGEAAGLNSVFIESLNLLPMDSRIRFTHGEWDFLGTTGNGASGRAGVIASCWSQSPQPTTGLVGCLYGLEVRSSSGLKLRPIVNGTVDTTQEISVSTSKRYVIRTIAEFTKTDRYTQEYTYLAADGTVQGYTNSPTGDGVVWQTIVTEIDPSNGQVTAQLSFYNSTTISSSAPYALYIPFVSDNLHATVTGITVSTPMAATLETKETVLIQDGSFEAWDDALTPTYWTNPDQVVRDADYSNSGYALKVQGSSAGDGSVRQDVHTLFKPNVAYTISAYIQKSTGATAGTIRIGLTGTGVSDTGLQLNVSAITDAYLVYEATLMAKRLVIPSDLTLWVDVQGLAAGTDLWVDDIIVTSDWEQKLIGPNEVDSADGMSPAATITGGNTGAGTKSSAFGTAQYNPGQFELSFFKDSFTQTSNIPPDFSLLRLSYRAAGSAIGRVKNGTSVTAQAVKWGDDGVRAAVRSDLQPRPRNSAECELAAAALVAENSYTHFEGDYTQWSDYFTDEPMAGGIVQFDNHPEVADGQVEEINEVVSTLECEKPGEHFNHRFTFGKPDRVRRLLAKFYDPKEAFQKIAAAEDPKLIDLTAVATSYVGDVTKPYLAGWTDSVLTINTGQSVESGCQFEVRYTDEGWGPQDGRNLILRTTSTSFSVPRTLRGRVFFIRQVHSSGIMSRFSTAMHVAFPATAAADTTIVEPTVDTPAADVVKNSGTDLFTGSLSLDWTNINASGARELQATFTYTPPTPQGSFVGVRAHIAGGSLGIQVVGDPDYTNTHPATQTSRVTLPDAVVGETLYLYLSSRSLTITNALDQSAGGTPYRTAVVPDPAGTSAGIEYCPVVTGQSATVEYGRGEDGQLTYRINGAFTHVGGTTNYGGCAILARPASGADIEITVIPKEANSSFTTEWTTVNHTSETMTILFLSEDKQGRRNSYQGGVTPTASITIVRTAGGAGQENTNLVTGFAANTPADIAYGEDGSQEYWFTGTLTPPAGDTRYKGTLVKAGLTGTVTATFGSTTMTRYTGPYFFTPHIGQRINVAGATHTITAVNETTQQITVSPGWGASSGTWVAVFIDELRQVADLGPTDTLWTSVRFTVNHQREDWRLFAVSYDYSNRENTLVMGTTPYADVVVTRDVGVAGREYADVVSGVTIDTGAAITVTEESGVTSWIISGQFNEPADPRYGGCKILRLGNIGDPMKNIQIGYVERGSSGKFRTDFQPTQALVTSLDIFFLSVDTSGRTNSYVLGTTPQVTVTVPNQGNTLNLAKILPGSLETAVSASTLRPPGVGSSFPTLPSTLYTAGTLFYYTVDNRLYRVQPGGTSWNYAINGGLDIVADSITGGQIQSGSIATSELFAGEILVGSSTGVGPTRFRVNDSGGSMIGFVGDIPNGTVVNGVATTVGYKGAYFLNLRIGTNINTPSFYFDQTQAYLRNVTFTLTTTSNITVDMNNSFYADGNYGIGVYSSAGVNMVKIRPGQLVFTDTVSGGVKAAFNTNNGAGVQFLLCNSSTQLAFQIVTGTSGTYPSIVLSTNGSSLAVGQTTTINYAKAGTLAAGSLTFTSGILTSFT